MTGDVTHMFSKEDLVMLSPGAPVLYPRYKGKVTAVHSLDTLDTLDTAFLLLL